MSFRRTLLTLLVMVTCTGLLFAGDQQKNTAAETIYNTIPSENIQPATRAPAPAPISTEAILYESGPVITHPGGAAGGADGSALQSGLGLTIFGYGHQGLSTVGNWVADDFTISDASGWTIDTLCFLGYQSFSPGTTSTFTAVRWRIYDGDPSLPASMIVCSDSATLVNGRLLTSWSGTYRATEALIATNVDRPIMANRCVVSPGCNLAAGTYWVKWQSWGTLASGPWCPPISILGQDTTGNGKQHQGDIPPAAGTWVNLVDVTDPQGVPFQIKGSVNADPCADYTNFVSRCTNDGTVQARVVLSMNTSHVGEIVEFLVDEDSYTAAIVTNGVSSRAQISIGGYTGLSGTVSVVDPAGCFEPRPYACDAASKGNAEWEADDARWAAEAQQAKVAPVATKLMGNYPNPFNPTTSINYALSADGFVSLKIYNTLGEEVATLVNEYQVAGIRSAVWNGRNESGLSVASGIYIYRLTAGNIVLSEKMLFMK